MTLSLFSFSVSGWLVKWRCSFCSSGGDDDCGKPLMPSPPKTQKEKKTGIL